MMSIRWAIRLRSLSELGPARAAGFTTVQLPVEAVMDIEEAGVGEFLRTSGAGLSFEVFEAPLPREVQVTEPGFNIYHWTEYLRQALARLSVLGCTTLVWGDGKARLMPVEGELATSRERFYQFMFLLCDNAARFGITVCLQPLGTKRTNFINSLDEALDSLAMVDKPNLGVAIGVRDAAEMKLALPELARHAASIRHVHVENPAVSGSLAPPAQDDQYDYRAFFSALKAEGYAGIISLAPGSDAGTLAYCTRLWNEAGATE
jgi:D-psicose/D-tagatose/L-ribulose 3-epimerase